MIDVNCEGPISKANPACAVDPCHKVVRIELQFDNGETYQALGTAAETIWQRYTEALMMDCFRGGSYQGPQLVKL